MLPFLFILVGNCYTCDWARSKMLVEEQTLSLFLPASNCHDFSRIVKEGERFHIGSRESLVVYAAPSFEHKLPRSVEKLHENGKPILFL